MPLRLGTDTNEAYKVTFGTTEVRAVYVGSIHIWPEYKISNGTSSLTHSGSSGNSYNFSNTNNNPSTLGGSVSGSSSSDTFPTGSFTPDIDPAGGTLAFDLYVNETSSWHYLRFQLLVPPEVTGYSLSGPNGLSVNGTSSGTTSYTCWSGQSYTASIIEFNIDSKYINNDNNATSTGYDKPIRITLTIAQNNSNNLSKPRYHEITLHQVFDEFNNSGVVPNTDQIITAYRQKLNFSLSVSNSGLGASYAHNQCGTTKTISNLNNQRSGTNLNLIDVDYWNVSSSNTAWGVSVSGDTLTLSVPDESISVCTNGSSTTLTFTYYYKLNTSDTSYLSQSFTANYSVAATSSWGIFVNAN